MQDEVDLPWNCSKMNAESILAAVNSKEAATNTDM